MFQYRMLLMASCSLMTLANVPCLWAQADITVDFNASDWVVHEASGRVFGSASDTAEVVEFDRQGEVRRFQVGEDPTELLIKMNRLIVGCKASTSLHVIDLDTNEVSGVVTLIGNGPYALFCSQADDGYAYCICYASSGWRDGEVFQIDLNSLSIRKQVKIEQWGQSQTLHVAMSRDGRWIVPDARGASISPTGADLMRVEADELKLTQVRDYHNSFGQIVAGPLNRYWTFGNLLYTLDITKTIRTFQGAPVAIHPHLDLAVSLTNGAIALQRFSDASSLGFIKFEVPDQTPPNPRQRVAAASPNQVQFDPTVQFDLKNQHAFVGLSTRGHWIDLQNYVDKLEPLQVIIAPSEISTVVGESLSVPLSVSNNSSAKRSAIAIENGPSSALIRDEKLIWTPSAADVGFHEVELVATTAGNGKPVDTAQLKIHVALPKVQLGFTAREMSLSPNGGVLAVWGSASGDSSRSSSQPGPDEIAIINTTSQKIISHKTVAQGIRSVLTGNQYIVLSPNSGNLFYRLDHDLQGNSRQFLQSTPRQFLKLSPSQIAALGSKVEVFDLGQMKALPFDGPANVQSHPAFRTVTPISRDVVQVAARVINSSTGKLLRITPGSALPSVANLPLHNRLPVHPFGFSLWGRRWYQGNLFNYQGRPIAMISGMKQGVLSDLWPLAIMVGTETDRGVTTRRLKICDLVNGTVVHSSVIDVSQFPNHPRSYSSDGDELVVHQNAIYVLNGSDLLFSSIPQSVAKEARVPAHFSEAQPIECAVGGMELLSLNMRGDRSHTEFTMTTETPAVELDPKSGELSIDTQLLWKNFLDMVPKLMAHYSSLDDQPSPLDAIVNARVYTHLLDKELPPHDFAFQLPISVILRNDEGQSDLIDFAIVVTGPRKELDSAYRQEQENVRQSMLAEQAKRNPAANATRPDATNASDEAMSKRLDDVESRLRRIEAAVDSILQRLEKSEN